MSRAALAASVSVVSLLAFGVMPAVAQQAGTLPGAQVLQGGRWTGAKLPTVAQGNNGLVMTIEQEQKKALLDWSRFDIAKNEEVHFKQQGADWIALNRIFDSKPSEIAGKITAKGQVWLQNTNGIIFRDGAQINAHTILATALPITEEQFEKGLMSPGNDVIRGTRYNPLFYNYSEFNLALVPRPVDGLDPTVLLGATPVAVGGQNPTIIDLMARAAIRQAVLRSRDYEGTSGTYDQGYGFDSLIGPAIPGATGTNYMINPDFSNAGLVDIMEAIVSEIDISQLGDFNYQNYTSPGAVFTNPSVAASIPQALRDAVAAQIKARFVDNYATLASAAKQKYANYIANSRITVERGATLKSVTDDASTPGKIMLFGPNVSNAGRLEAHDGQVLMAAGEQIKLSAVQLGGGFGSATNAVRGGLAVSVMAVPGTDAYGSFPGMACCRQPTYDAWNKSILDRVGDVGMLATNTGEIFADRGAVTMVGRNVDQFGSILVTNGVRQRNGTIVLQASHGFNMSDGSIGANYFAGSLHLGENSVTRITPDLSSLTGLAADTFAPGKILLAGNDILLDRNAEVTSRSGEVVIHASPSGAGARGGFSPGGEGEQSNENRGDKGGFTMRSGARIDVSGLTDVERGVAENIFAVEVRANEVSGAPKQRDGILVGETVYVDRRDGAEIVDWTGALNGEQRTAAQMSTKGGSVQIRASEFAIVEDGAIIDVSGGSTKYVGGEIKTTRLQDSYGRFHDISDADPNLKYVSMYEATRTEQGYIEGADAGSVELLSGSARLFGKLKGDVVVGERQQLASIGQIKAPRTPVGAVGAAMVTTSKLPETGSVALHRGGPEYGTWSSRYSFIMADENAFTATLHSEVVNAEGADEWIEETALLNPMLVGQDWTGHEGKQDQWTHFVEDDFFNGMGDVSFSYGGSHQTQTINSGVSIHLAPGGGFGIGAEGGFQTVGDNVSIIAPSGEIGFGAGMGVTMGRDVLLSVAAPWVNDVDAPVGTSLGYIDGGSVNLLGVKLTGPITIDAGGGGWYKRLSPATLNHPGAFLLVEGKGGDIVLGQNDMTLTKILGLVDFNLAGLGGGGELGLHATGDLVVGPQGGGGGEAEFISDTLLNGLGAGSLTLGAGSIAFVDGANVLFQQHNMIFDGSPLDVATGADLRDVTRLALLPDHLRSGASMTFQASEISVAGGALIEVDPLGSLMLSADELSIDGTLRAHGGAITVGGSTSGDIRIGSAALLDVTGVAQTVKVPGGADGRGYWYSGRILDGGSILVSGDNLIIDSGALLDVSGTTGMLAVYRPGRYAVVKVNDIIGSDAGAIDITAKGGYILGTLRGDGGTAYNYAGTLTLGGGAEPRMLVPGPAGVSDSQLGVEYFIGRIQSLLNTRLNSPTTARQYTTFAEMWGRHANLATNRTATGLGEADVLPIVVRATPGTALGANDLNELKALYRVGLELMTNPGNLDFGLFMDPTLTAVPTDGPPSGPITVDYKVPQGMDPIKFKNTMIAISSILGQNFATKGLRNPSRLTIGATPLANMKTFDTVTIGGFNSDHAVEVASKRVLNINGVISGTHDTHLVGRNINLSGPLATGQLLDAATAGTLTISGETVEFRSKFNVGGFEKVVIEASGDMRGGYLSGNVPAPGLYATGDVLLRAAQIYPTTDGILAFESPKTIRIEKTGSSLAPLSAGGLLTFTAPLIEQAGTLRAPFGEIRLNAVGTTTTDEGGLETYTPGRVELLAGSVTSTAADGRTILYGYTYDGQSWYAPKHLGNSENSPVTAPQLTTPPEKRVSLSGDVIDVQAGAVIDVSGGGDVLGLEFVAGPLGQANVLDGPGVYAIVAAYGSDVIAPIDPLYNPGPRPVGTEDPNATGLTIGDAVWLAAFDGNKAGWYTLLPAEYALTPGGYRITLAEGLVPAVPESRLTGDDSFAVLGHRGVLGTTIADQVQSTYRMERGADVRNRSEYFETSGNSFFSSERFLEGLLRSGNPYNADPRLPVDGGFLTLAANSSLKLDGTILAAGMTGEGARGGVVDITADNIVIAAQGTDVSDLAGYLVLDPNSISNIAESLLIGGIRRQGASGLEIVTGQMTRASATETRTPEKSVGAENVIIRTDAANPLTGAELMFAANQTVRVENGAVVRATGDGADAADLAIAPSLPAFVNPQSSSQNRPAEDRGGAFLRVSNLGDILVSRTNVISDAGDMIVDAGATIEATDSIILDATENTLVGNGATVRAGAITAASGLVSFGAAPAGTDGLVMSGGTLEGLAKATKLTLKSYSTFDFYGEVTLNLTGAAVFDGAAFVDRGTAPGNVSISAGTLELRNSGAAVVDEMGEGGTLALKGGNVVFGEGDIDLAYATTTIDAGERLIFAGQGDNNFDGALTVRAAEITGDSGAGHEVRTAGALHLLGNGSTAVLPVFATAGALLDFIGANVEIGTAIRAGSGTVRATATTGDVHVASGSVLDVGGADVSFFEVQGFLPGGGVQLTSAAGDVLVDAGSTVNISGGKAGGDAGTLVLSAGRGIAVLGGALEAKVAGGYRGGGFGLTTSTLADFGGLNALLNASGFSRSRDFAILDGDVTLNGTTRVDALRIVTGSGNINVAADARIGSDSAKGGSILLASGGDLIIADGAAFDVNAKGTNLRGGSIDLQIATGGSIDVGAAVINVAGAGTGEGGEIRLRAPQAGADVGVARWAATVSGGGTQLEAFRVYDLGDADGDAGNGHLAEIDTALQTAVIGDAAAFMTANAADIRTRLGQADNASFAIVPGIELRSAGDLDLVHNWNLKDARFNGQPGVLTLRAGGGLLINANLSDGFVNAMPTPDLNNISVDGNNQPIPGSGIIPDADLTNDRSWSYNLVAGADFEQTNVLSTLAGNGGNIEVGGLVRTGTGDIRIAASGDMNYEAASIISYQGEYRTGTQFTVPKGTVIADGTVLKPTTYPGLAKVDRALNPSLTSDIVLRQNITVPNGTKFGAGTKLPAGTRLPAGTVMPDGSSLTAPLTLTSDMVLNGVLTLGGAMQLTSNIATNYTVNPELPAGTVMRKGTRLPSGTTMPDGSTLAADTVLMADLMLTQDTTFPGEVTIAGKTRLGSDYVWFLPSEPSVQAGGPVIRGVPFSIAGLGDVTVWQAVGNSGATEVELADGRRIEDENSLGFDDIKPLEMLHGAIYTAGVQAAAIDNFTPPEQVNTIGYMRHRINPLYAEGGGDVSVNVGGAIRGAGTLTENANWLAFSGGSPKSADYGFSYGGKDPEAVFTRGQTSISLLMDRFRQGIGALGGGDITIVSGGDVDNLMVALPTTQRVSGGMYDGDTKQLHFSGGGDLVMDVGRDLLGGMVLLSKGNGAINVAGSVRGTEQTTAYHLNSVYRTNLANLVLAIDDAQVALQAGGDVTLQSVTSTTGAINRWMGRENNQFLWLGYTENSAARVTSLGGDINLAGMYGFNVLPSKTALVATAGSIKTVASTVDAWSDTELQILAKQNVSLGTVSIGFSDPTWVARAFNPGSPYGGNFGVDQYGVSISQFIVPPYFDTVSGQWTFNQAGPGFGLYGGNIHSGSSSFSRIYAGDGNLTGGDGSYFGHETRLKAGGDIRLGAVTFIHHDGADMSVMEAGKAIYMPNAVLYGPGRLWVQAADEIWMGRAGVAPPGASPDGGYGIRAREAVSLIPTTSPVSGGSISVLAGIDQSPEYDAFFDYYLDPEAVAEAPTWLRQYFIEGDRAGLTVSADVVLKDGTTKATVYAIELVNYMRGLRGDALIPTEATDEVSGSRPITRGKLAAAIEPAEYAEALVAFNALDPLLKRPLAIRILNAELKTAGREAVGRSAETDGRHLRQGDPTRGYDAIGRLFPGAQRKPGEALAEGEHKWTGDINMVVNQIRADSGGDVDLVVPGGRIQLASLSVNATSPASAGVVTQRKGSVSALTYGDYIVNQSRTMTADDGDILIWSSYGNIDAGRGRKSSLSVPPVAFLTDAFGQTRIRLSGLPNGAGIATLDQVDGKQGGDVDLYAFNGIVNAGDAGIRASRDLFVGAIEIRGLDNITVGGETNVDLGTEKGSVGPLNLENFAQSAEDEALDRAFDMTAEVEKLRTVRQTILTGSVVSFGTDDCVETDTNRCQANR